jgi:hypothetical protein
MIETMVERIVASALTIVGAFFLMRNETWAEDALYNHHWIKGKFEYASRGRWIPFYRLFAVGLGLACVLVGVLGMTGQLPRLRS